MQKTPIRILLIENDAGDAKLVKEFLKDVETQSFQTTWVDCLKKAERQLVKHKFDIVLSDLDLPDSTGLYTIEKLHTIANPTPIVVLTGIDDNQLALQVIKQGAQDYLHKDKLNEEILFRLIRYAIERNRIILESKENEEKFRSVVESANDAVVSANSNGNIIFLNKAAERMFGFALDEVLKKPLTVLMPKRYRDAHRKGIDRFLATGERHISEKGVELAGRRRDRTEFPIELSLSSWMEGGDTYFTAIIRDISDRKEAELELKASKERYFNFFNNSLNGFALHQIVTNKKGTPVDYIFLEVNKAFEKIVGFKAEDVVGRRVTDVIPQIKDDPFIEIYGKVALTGEPNHFEIYAKALDRHFEIAAFSPKQGQFASIFMDVTERKRAENSLKASENKFRSIIENATDFIFMKDKDRKYTFVNEAMQKLLGLPEKQIIGKTPQEIFGPKQALTIKEVDDRTFLGETINETRNLKIGAKQFCFNTTQTPLVMEDGEVTSIMGIVREVTAQKKAEKALRDQERKLRTIIEHSNELFYIHDTNHTLTYVSPQCQQILGYSPEEMMVNWTALTTENPLNGEGFGITERAIKTGERQPPYLLELKRKNGEHRFVEVDESPVIDENGKVIGISGALRDVTEKRHSECALKESEEKFRTLAEQSPNAIFINQKGRIVYANKRSFEALGYTEAELYADDFDFFNLIAPGSHDVVKNFFKQHMEGKEVEPYEYTILTKDGTRIEAINSTKLIEYKGQKAILGVATDITERKQAEKALMESEERFRTVFEKGPMGIALIGPNRKYIRTNKTLCQLFGYSKEELNNLTFLDITHPDDYNRDKKAAEDLFSGKIDFFKAEKRYIKKNKDFIWANIRVSAIRDLAGKVKYLIAMIEDITERKKAEEGLRLFRELIDQSNDAIEVIDPETGQFLDVNQKSCIDLGYSREEILSMTIFDIDPTIDKASFKSMGISKAGLIFEGVHRRKDGSTFPVEVNIKEVKLDRIYGVTIVRDITERRKTQETLQKSEEKYRRIFEESKDAIYISTPEGKFIDINPAGVELFGYDSKEELMKIDISHDLYVNPTDRQRFEKELINRDHVKDFELKLKKKDGQKVIALVTSTSIKNEDGKIIGYRGIIRDITEQKRLERQLVQALKMEAIGTLAGGIAHDFNNILSAILGYTEITKSMISENGNGIIKNNLDQVYKAGLRAKDLTQQILTFSRQTDHNPQPLLMECIIKEAIKLMRASLPATIEIRQSISEDCGYTLADPTQVHQMMMNLCTNAFDAMREKGGVLEVILDAIYIDQKRSVESTNLTPGKYLRLIVRDTGTGMDAETLKRVFDPFFTTKPAGAGTGLGLSVAHGAVKKHGGEITVQSQRGVGSTFTVYLPEIDAKAIKMEEPQKAALQGTEKILYVDDEEPIVQTGIQILEKLGYRVAGKTKSLEALEAFKQAPDQFDLVITDLIMPNMTGVELAKKMLEIRPDIPIILITGYSESVTKEKAKRMGIKDLIMKPVVSADLSRAIRENLDGQKVGV